MTNQCQSKRQPLLILALVLALLPIFTLTSMSTSAATGPTVIRTQEDLVAIGIDESSLSGNYVLGNDIVLNEIEPESGYYVGDGMVFTTFTGTFDGANHTISNLLGPLFQVVGDGESPTSITHLILSTAETGLPSSFTGILTEQLSELSLVNDVHVSGKLVQGEDCPVGGIAGRGRSNSAIENSSADVTIVLGATNDDAGGLIGSTSGNISNSFAKVSISGDAAGKIGGLVGTAEQGSTIINSASSGTINGGGTNQGTYFGGLVGYSQGSTVTKSASSVQINTGQDSIVGGLIGWAENSPDDSTSTLISNSFASGAVTNQGDKAGGLIGYIDKGTVSNCVAMGDVSGYLNVGGLVGYSESTNIQRSSAQGHISGSKYVGGLIGQFATNIPSTVQFSTASGLVEFLNSPAALEYLVSQDGLTPTSFGGLIGYVDEQATLLNLSATGNVLIEASVGVIVEKIGGLIGASSSDVSQASASGYVTAVGGDLIGGLIGLAERKLFHTITSGTVTGATQVGQLVGRCNDEACLNNSKSTGHSTATLDGTRDILEGAGDKTSDNVTDSSGEGPTGPIGPPVLGVELLNLFDPLPESLPWAQSAGINGNQPHLQALLGTGFYVESAPAPSITPSTQSVSGVTNSVITPTTAFTPVNFTSPVYTVSPALPAGLGINPGTGVISGTPTSASPSTSYVVTATSGAQSAIATVTLGVTAAPVVYIPPPPQPYLSVGTAPAIRKVENLALCSSGTYDYGVTYFDGTPNSLTKNVSLIAYQYRFFIDGVENKDLAVSSAAATISIPISKLPATGLLTCHVAVERGGVSIVASSTLNTTGLGAAEALRNGEIEKANLVYQSTLKANSDAKKSALIANRKSWRDSVQLAGTVFAASRTAAKSSKEVVAASKIQSLAVAKAAANYKQGIVLIDRDYLNMNLLAENTRKESHKNANSVFASILDANGYGVTLE